MLVWDRLRRDESRVSSPELCGDFNTPYIEFSIPLAGLFIHVLVCTVLAAMAGIYTLFAQVNHVVYLHKTTERREVVIRKSRNIYTTGGEKYWSGRTQV